MAALDLTVLNNGNPTFERGVSKTHIDLTIVNRARAAKIRGWEILEGDSMSVHKYIKLVTASDVKPIKSDARAEGINKTRLARAIIRGTNGKELKPKRGSKNAGYTGAY